MERFNGLQRLKGKVFPRKVFGIDIETTNRNKNFYCASIVGEDYVFYTEKREELIKELVTNQKFRNSYLCATNLMFDFFGIFQREYALHNFKTIERGGGLVFAQSLVSYKAKDFKFYHPDKIRNALFKEKDIEKRRNLRKGYYPLVFIDSLNHLKASVDNLGKIVGVNKMENPSFLGKTPKNKKEKRYLKLYNIRDSEVTYKFMKFLQENYNSIGCNMKITIASTSMDLFRRKYHKGFWKQENRDIINYLYNAYYGGRTEAFKRGLFNVDNYGKIKVFDVNSLYPFMLKNRTYPDPNTVYYSEHLSLNEVEGLEGVGYFELTAPKDLSIPFLPVKSDKLLFPSGEIKGYYDFYSIRKALNLGYQLNKMTDGYVYSDKFKPFKQMIGDLYDMRMILKKRKDSTELVAKILMNSFYGKFGYNYKGKEIIGDDEDILFLEDDKTIIPIGQTGFYRITTGQDSFIPPYVFPSIPLYVTAYSRGMMFDSFKKTGLDRVFYTDTDCIFTDRNLKTSEDIGELKLEETFKEVIIIKPKFYMGIFENDKTVIKLKGVKHYKNDDNQKEWEYYNKLKSMIQKDKIKLNQEYFRKLRGSLIGNGRYVNEVFTMKKEISLNDNKRIWDKPNFTLKPQESIPIVL